jgi:esterase/lipase superfamily enzyme
MDSLKTDEFVTGIRDELSHWTKRTALVLIHGYNVSFREAALQAAQIGFDLRVDGVMALFSWPSKGDLIPYTADESSIELVEKHFVSFIEMLSSIHELESIDILAHSMGKQVATAHHRKIGAP